MQWPPVALWGSAYLLSEGRIQALRCSRFAIWFTAELRYCRYSFRIARRHREFCLRHCDHPAIANRSADAYPCGALAYSDHGAGFVVSFDPRRLSNLHWPRQCLLEGNIRGKGYCCSRRYTPRPAVELRRVPTRQRCTNSLIYLNCLSPTVAVVRTCRLRDRPARCRCRILCSLPSVGSTVGSMEPSGSLLCITMRPMSF
jgi:hypothetical protein